MWLKTFHTIN